MNLQLFYELNNSKSCKWKYEKKKKIQKNQYYFIHKFFLLIFFSFNFHNFDIFYFNLFTWSLYYDFPYVCSIQNGLSKNNFDFLIVISYLFHLYFFSDYFLHYLCHLFSQQYYSYFSYFSLLHYLLIISILIEHTKQDSHSIKIESQPHPNSQNYHHHWEIQIIRNNDIMYHTKHHQDFEGFSVIFLLFLCCNFPIPNLHLLFPPKKKKKNSTRFERRKNKKIKKKINFHIHVRYYV